MFALDGILFVIVESLARFMRLTYGFAQDVFIGIAMFFFAAFLYLPGPLSDSGLFFLSILFVIGGIFYSLPPFIFRVRYGLAFLEDLDRQAMRKDIEKVLLYQTQWRSLSFTSFRLLFIFLSMAILYQWGILASLSSFSLGCAYYSIALYYLQKKAQ